MTTQLQPATPDEVERLCGQLQAYNRPYTQDHPETSIHIVARNKEGALLGCILGEVELGWLEIHVLWVEPEERGTGLGTTLLSACEQKASLTGARSARLDTFDWQAEAFYARHGYSCFARLEDYPAGHERVFMRKALSAAQHADDHEAAIPSS